MDRATAKKALSGLRSRYGMRRAAPLMGEDRRRRLGITIELDGEGEEHAEGPGDEEEDEHLQVKG